MTRKSTLSPESAAVIKHLKEHGSSTAFAMHPQFQDMSRTQLLKRLGNLVDLGWLDFTWNNAGDKMWFLRASARAIPVHTVADEAPHQAAPAPPVLVPPRRINVMVGNYTPPPMAPARPGALDYQRYASQGVRC